METKCLEKAKSWASNPYFDKESQDEILNLIEKNDIKEITERFYKNLEFGTGGMRSILGQGLNRINIYTIRKATQALATVINLNKKPDNSIAISYDSRKFSFEFAKEVASVMAANNITAHIYRRLNPVCLLSFAVRDLGASAGVMVTASHNPPEYNGYKVFWNDGAQVTPPNDQNIIDEFDALTDFSKIKTIPFEEGVKAGSIKWLEIDMEDKYFSAIQSAIINKDLCKKEGSKLKIVYTPIHGTGLIPCTRALEELGMTNVHVVESQAMPDEKFPTVSSPNPENPEALALSVELMKNIGADIAMGSDPDTDRLGIAFIKDEVVKYLNGNQIGLLMLHYILENLKEQNRLPENAYFVKTIVTTPLQEKLAQNYGVECYNTLTGFKWICGLMNKMEKEFPEKTFLFGTEESFGYLNHLHARDKDGVSSITLMAEVALWYKLKGLDLQDALDELYKEYGFSNEALLCLTYKGKEGSEKISRIMDNFRSYTQNQLAGEEIDYLVDYKSGLTKYFTNLEGRNNEKLDLPSSNVLGFTFKDGTQLFLRPSGTEPKIKFYLMINEGGNIPLEEMKKKAITKTNIILDEMTKLSNEA